MKFAACIAATAIAVFVQGGASDAAGTQRSRAERDFARTVDHVSAHDVTGNLLRDTGKHVSFVCTVTDVVDPATMIGQCGNINEPVDLYVMMPTKSLHVGTKLRVLGEMLTPAQWIDVTGHAWLTAMMRARFVDRL